jgi:prephenate dehydrogenase
MRVKRLVIIGVGLIGGSLARALKHANACEEVIGVGRDERQLKKAIELGVIDQYSLDPREAVKTADIIVLAVPLGAMASIFKSIAGLVPPDAVITDVGSAKASVVNAAKEGLGEIPVNFVPGHPIAGTEKSGVEASFRELFEQRKIILTPLKETKKDAVARVRAMWEMTGAEVLEMDIEHHDKVLAATSHLPHMLAYALVDTLARMGDHDEIFSYAAGGFHDFTRIASSDPQMWHDICTANKDALLQMLELFIKDLSGLTEAIRNNESAYLLETFNRAKQARDHFAQVFNKNS